MFSLDDPKVFLPRTTKVDDIHRRLTNHEIIWCKVRQQLRDLEYRERKIARLEHSIRNLYVLWILVLLWVISAKVSPF